MNILDSYKGLDDLKGMSRQELAGFAEEIRTFLVESVSKTGGHLSSNLGVVELTLAVHKVYDSGYDKIIWDVGHQSYVHKILTGRKEGFKTLRQYGGMSGFPKRKESVHDVFDTGHSSTSISAGLGFALSRDIKDEKYKVVSIIGDGAMTAGMAFEALNHAGDKNTSFTIILNDNEMSIAENVGGLSKYLYKLRNEAAYSKVKSDIGEILEALPGGIGSAMLKTTGRMKNSLKYALVPGIFFEDLGFKYLGPVDGHNMDELVDVLETAKRIEGPNIVHVITKKGKGYGPAERDSEKFHGISPFDVATGELLSQSTEKTYSDVLGETLVELAGVDDKIVAITAAMPSGTGLDKFKAKYPGRYFDVGIAEQHGVTLAAGMAANGLKPYFAVYSSFLQRAYDQVLHDVCIQNLPVTFAIDRGGLVGNDGETHHGVFDLSYLSHMPNMTIVSPKDKREFEDMIGFSAGFDGPMVIRYSKGICSDCFGIRNDIEYGKSEVLIQGEKVALLAVGRLVETANCVAERLKGVGIRATLVNARFVKPLDAELIGELAGNHSIIVTLEDNAVAGGYGSLVNRLLLDLDYKGKVKNVGIEDRFVEHGDNKDLYRAEKIDEESLYDLILKLDGEY